MKLYLLCLSVVLLAESAVSLRCYRCYNVTASTDDPGLDGFFKSYTDRNEPPCDGDKKGLHKNCPAGTSMCGVYSIYDWSFETIAEDGTVGTGVWDFYHRGCVTYSQKEYPEGCYPASSFMEFYEPYIRQGLGGFTGQINQQIHGTICVCKNGWCNDGPFILKP